MLHILRAVIVLSLIFASPCFAATQLKDEGVHKGWITSIDCVGDGIAATASGIQGTITLSGTGAPDDADYLVGTANASLSAEIAVGTTPGGELGGTWASPTIDSVHSGSAHHSAITLSGTPDYITLSGQDIVRGTIDISDDTNLTAGDALTLTDDDIDFDGGAAPAGELGGTWASPTIDSTHAGSAHHAAVTVTDSTTINLTLSTQDIQADGLYTAGDALTLTGADFDFDGGVTPAGELGGTWASPTVDSGIHDDEYVNLNAESTNITNGTFDMTTIGTGTFGQIIDNGLTASLGVYTDASKQLTSTAPTSGNLGYWNRTGTVVSPVTDGDIIEITSTSTAGDFLRFVTSVSGSTYWWEEDQHGAGNDLEFWGPAGKMIQYYDNTTDVVYYGSLTCNALTIGAQSAWNSGAVQGIFYGSGGSFVAGDLLFQSRGNLSRDIRFATNNGASIGERLRIRDNDTWIPADLYKMSYGAEGPTDSYHQWDGAGLDAYSSGGIFDWNAAADTDITFNFIGTTNSGVMKWMEDEDYFEFGDNVTANGTVEGATLTEGGNAVYNATETPGGVLGGTWATPTLDSNVGSFAKSFVITNPTATADGAVWRVPAACTITAVHGVQVGGTNVVGHLTECDANGLNPAGVDGATDMTILTTNVNDDGSLSNPSIDSGDYIGWRTTSVSGTITRVTISFEGTWD